MSLYVNDQKFSDSEIAEGVKQRKQERHDWCEQKAREFLANKPRGKFYHTYCYIPEADVEHYLRLSQDDIDWIQAALADDIKENGPYADEKDKKERREEVFMCLELDGRNYIDEPYEFINITDVDFDDFNYAYNVRVIRFDNHGTKKKFDDYYNVSLTDEEYIQVVTELLYSPSELSFDGLRHLLPDVCNHIYDCCCCKEYNSAIILNEINQDVNTILEQNGGRDKTPHIGLFNNIFVLMAEYAASKKQNDA